jgi:hypothetical protein
MLRWYLADFFSRIADRIDPERVVERRRDDEAIETLVKIAKGEIPAAEAQKEAYIALY